MNDLRHKASIPSFLSKLYEMLEDEKFSQYIGWIPSGQGFVVYNPTELSQKVLPNYFKHRNYPSFLRQLNMYNFKKTKNEYGFSEFRHKWFRKGVRSLLQYIKRRNQDEGEEKIELKDCDVDQYKKEHEEIKDMVRSVVENQKQLQKDFQVVLQQTQNFAKEAFNFSHQIRQIENGAQKKFDRLAVIVGKIISGMENEDVQTKLNQLFTQALLGEESPSFSELGSQLDMNNTLQENRLSSRMNNDFILCSGPNSPYRSFEIANPYYNMMFQRMNPTNVLSNFVLDQNLFMQMQLQNTPQLLGLPQTLPLQLNQQSRFQSPFPSHLPSVPASPNPHTNNNQNNANQ